MSDASTPRSLWAATARLAAHPSLEGDQRTDVLIIGGGMTGVLCAHFLHQAGVPYLLLEASRLGGGVTGGTTAKLTLLHGLRYGPMLRSGSRERALHALRAQQQALARYRDLCRVIDCDYEERPAYVYDTWDRRAVEREAEALRALGAQAEFVERVPLPLEIAGAVRCPRQAQFHPLKFLSALSAPLNIREHTPVLDVRGRVAITPRGRIIADTVVFACRFPFVDRLGLHFARLHQRRSYILALAGAPLPQGMFVDARAEGLSFRTHDDLLLLGGGDHRTGCAGGGLEALRAFAAAHYPMATERYAWAAQDCVSLDGLPYIGPSARTAPRWVVATGFSKWGMSSAMVAALLLRDVMLGEASPYADAFSPRRAAYLPALLANGGAYLARLLTPAAPRCPHLGCALRWNAAERSWDCPCHGSRFDASGAILDNPATRRLNSTHARRKRQV